MIKEIATYINANTSLVLESTLWTGFRPSNAPNDCVVILETGGGKVDSDFPDAGDRMIQILSRAKSYWDARSNIYLVHDVMKSKAQIDLPQIAPNPQYRMQFVEAVDFPQSLGQDEKGLWEFSQNFVIRMREI